MSLVRFTRYEYEEPYHLHLRFEASNGDLSTTLDFYIDRSDLKEIGNHLVDFGGDSSNSYVYELGSEEHEDNCAYYFELKVLALDDLGHSCIAIKTNNNRQQPHLAICQFCIEADPIQINELGELFLDFYKLKHNVLEWSGSAGELR